MRYFVVVHNFHAEEDVELSVLKDEVLRATEGVVQDGWIKVELATDGGRRGFVPLSYMHEISAAEAMSLMSASAASAKPAVSGSPSLIQTPQRAGGDSPVTAPRASVTPTTSLDMEARAAVATKESSSAILQSMHSAQTATVSFAPVGGPVNSAPAQHVTGPVSRHLLENPEAVVDAFMKNEVYFNQLMQRRSSALTQMQSGLEEAMTEVAACKDCSSVLARKLRDWDEVVERERQRWMNRVDEEKAHVNRSVPYSTSLAAPRSSRTTPNRSAASANHSEQGRGVSVDGNSRELLA